MAWGDGKKDLELAMELGSLKASVEHLTRENAALTARCEKLQEKNDSLMDTILAVEHPHSYQMIQDDRAGNGEEPFFDDAQRQKFMEEQRIMADMRDAHERPLFSSPDELKDMFHRSQGVPSQENQSIHGNDES
jgi:hypothetical protein